MVVFPAHIVVLPVMAAEGEGSTEMARLAVSTQVPLVTITEYVFADVGVTMIVLVRAPVFQR